MSIFTKLWSYLRPRKKKSKVVLVIGETGVGKTSLINLIAEENVAKTSKSFRKETFKTDDYKYEDFIMVETVGYTNLTDKYPEEAFRNLTNFTNKILTDGISLIIYVMKMGRVTAASKKNYDFFVNTVCRNKVPVLLVVTHSELADDGGMWWYRKQVALFKDLKMNFSSLVCGCAIDLTDSTIRTKYIHFLAHAREATRDKLLDMMEVLVLEEAWKPEKRNEWIVEVFVGATAFGLSLTVLSAILPTLIPVLGGSVD